MTDSKENKYKHDKGVNVTVGSPKKTALSDSDASSSGKSLHKIKNDVKTVIELMGPNTPHFNYSTSNLADNEESYYSNTTVSCLKKSKTEEVSIIECDCTDQTIASDITLQEKTDLSMIASKNSTAQDLPTNEMPQCPQLICPPPWLPPNVVFNSECVCSQIADYVQNITGQQEVKETKNYNKPKGLLSNFLKTIRDKRTNHISRKCEYYTMNIKQSRENQGIPKRLVFDLVDVIPKREDCHCKLLNDHESKICNKDTCENLQSKDLKNFNNELLTKQEDLYIPVEKINENYIKSNKNLQQKATITDFNGTTRVDVYYFDHGDSNYLRTTDYPPRVKTETVAEKTEAYTTEFWAELFGTIHIGVSFCTSFVLQFFRFLLYSLLRPLTIGLMQLASDYFLKPCLATTFNACIQPPLTFFYNVASSIRDLCGPLAEGCGYFLREISHIIRAFRIVDVKSEKCSESHCKYDRKVDKKKQNSLSKCTV